MNNNGATARWISIIVMVVITMASLAFGVIKASNKERIAQLQYTMQKYQDQLERHEELITSMRESRARTDVEIRTIQNQLKELNKKMDIIIAKLR